MRRFLKYFSISIINDNFFLSPTFKVGYPIQNSMLSLYVEKNSEVRNNNSLFCCKKKLFVIYNSNTLDKTIRNRYLFAENNRKFCTEIIAGTYGTVPISIFLPRFHMSCIYEIANAIDPEPVRLAQLVGGVSCRIYNCLSTDN